MIDYERIFATLKRSLRQGNVFTRLSFCPWHGRSLYDVTSYLAAWSQVSSRGSLSLVPCSRGGLCPGSLCLEDFCLEVSVHGGLCPWGLCPGGFLSRGSLSRGSLSRGTSVQGGLCQGEPPRHTVKNMQYASYWNAFLFKNLFSSFWK